MCVKGAQILLINIYLAFSLLNSSAPVVIRENAMGD